MVMTVLLGGAALVAVLGGYVRWLHPPLRDFFRGLAGAIDNVNGSPAKYDKANREVRPAVPSLSVQLADLRDAVKDQTEQNRRITAVEETQVEHGRRIDRLEGGAQLERLAAQAVQGKVVDAIDRAHQRTSANDGAIDEAPE